MFPDLAIFKTGIADWEGQPDNALTVTVFLNAVTI